MSKQEIKAIVDDIQRVSNLLEVKPHDLSKNQYMSETTFKEWTLRKYGGFQGIKNTYFPYPEKELGDVSLNAELRSYIKKLETAVGQKDKISQIMRESFAQLEPVNIKPYKMKFKESKETREMTVMFNDMHYGLIVHADEVGNVNHYDWEVASRRTAFVVGEVCRYKRDKREHVRRLNVVINGDIIQGMIHDLTARTAELSVHQCNGALHILGHAIARFSENFNEVVVHLITGNHEDMPHRREAGHRVSSHPYDSFCNLVGFGLSAMFRHTPNVKFNIPKTPYVFVNTIGGRIMVAHGDKVFSRALGNPGSTINVKRLSDEIHRFNLGEVAKGEKPIRVVLMGHVHTHASFTTHDGVLVYIAPSLSGVDPYAHNTLSVNRNIIGQVAFETTEDYIFGDSRLIQPDSADSNKSLDEIIPPFKNQLKWE